MSKLMHNVRLEGRIYFDCGAMMACGLADPRCQTVDICWSEGSALMNMDRLGYVCEDFAQERWKKTLACARLMAAAPDLLRAAERALADLEGIMPEFGHAIRMGQGWTTIEELKQAITKAKGDEK